VTDREIIYFDNAATSWPKPPGVAEKMSEFVNCVGANPGRSGHRLSIEAARIVFDAREKVTRLFNSDDPGRVVFGLNATEGLNLALKGVLRSGDHVITSGMEHNSVMRPLREMEKRNGIKVTVVKCSSTGHLDPDDLKSKITPETKMVVLNSASNVVGTLLPFSEVGKICREHGLLFTLDTAQTGGCYPVDMKKDNVDMLAFTGHKAMLGPQGIGGLVIGERVDTDGLIPLKQGGTGSRSELETHPSFLPDLCEAGTPNTVGAAGLEAGLDFILSETVEKIHCREQQLIKRLIEGMSGIPKIKLVGDPDPGSRVPTISFNIDGMQSSEVGLRLDDEFGIMCRVGLHCAPAAHRTLGTAPEGTVRFGLSYFTTEDQIDYAVDALIKISD